MIPPRLIRSVPLLTSPETEAFWARAGELHPSWELVTYRDPIHPAMFPLTRPHWAACSSGAQQAGLIRLEALLADGGVWLDADLELYRPLTALQGLQAFAGWEDAHTIPDFVLGAEPGHPAIARCLELAIDRIGDGAWKSGPGVCTEVLPGRPDVLLLPPGSFAPYHYSEKHRRHEDHQANQPWAFGAHHWSGSWL